MKIIIFIFLFLFFASCSTIQKSNYKESAGELQDLLKNKKLDETSKIVIKHAINDLNNADKTQKENTDLTKKVIKESKEAGAGNMIYTILYIGAGIFAGIIVLKVMKKI